MKVAYLVVASMAFAALAEAIVTGLVTLGAVSGATTTGIGASTVIAGLAAALGKSLDKLSFRMRTVSRFNNATYFYPLALAKSNFVTIITAN